jgi:hypothetical protein
MPDDSKGFSIAAVDLDPSVPTPDLLANPDMSVLRLNRRPPPPLPMEVFSPTWADWIANAAEAAACSPDYVAAPLLAMASALIGNARWAQANDGWAEPPHLWTGAVGDSGSGKSPGADALMRDVLPELERRMLGDFPDRLRAWKATVEAHAAAMEMWQADVRTARNQGNAAPLPPAESAGPEPQAPRLRQSDVTIEKVATLLATSAPKGLLLVRDELMGWLAGLNQYNDAGRAFWLEAYGGRPYRLERQKHPEPIVVPHNTVAVTGGTQPDKLAEVMRAADDGFLSRICWFWPDAIPFRLGRAAPGIDWATTALDRLRLLELAPPTAATDAPHPIMLRLDPTVLPELEEFGQDMQERQASAGGLMRSALGKARGLALRLALVLEHLWWCAREGYDPPPAVISKCAFLAAAHLVSDYFMPMAERVYGDAAATPEDRHAATLARWIIKTRAREVHVRRLQREVRLPGLTTAEAIHAAARALIDAGWLTDASKMHVNYQQRGRAVYAVNPRVFDVAAEP